MAAPCHTRLDSVSRAVLKIRLDVGDLITDPGLLRFHEFDERSWLNRDLPPAPGIGPRPSDPLVLRSLCCRGNSNRSSPAAATPSTKTDSEFRTVRDRARG
jgi:hypothetical protein